MIDDIKYYEWKVRTTKSAQLKKKYKKTLELLKNAYNLYKRY